MVGRTEKNIVFCGDFNKVDGAKFSPSSKREDALVSSSLLCLNEGQVTRLASRPGYSAGDIHLALVWPSQAKGRRWQAMGHYGSDHLRRTILFKKQKPKHIEPAPAAFTNNKDKSDTLCNIRRSKLQIPNERRIDAT